MQGRAACRRRVPSARRPARSPSMSKRDSSLRFADFANLTRCCCVALYTPSAALRLRFANAEHAVLLHLQIGAGHRSCWLTPQPAPPVSIARNWKSSCLQVPLIYYFGNVSPSENDALYRAQVSHMGAMLQQRATAEPEVRCQGVQLCHYHCACDFTCQAAAQAAPSEWHPG